MADEILNQGRPVYSVVDYPPEAYENSPIPMPPTATFGFVNQADIVHDPDYGTLMYLPNHPYPMKGLRRGDKLITSDLIKKTTKRDLSLFASSPLRYFIGLSVFLPSFLFKEIIVKWLDLFGDLCAAQTSRYWLDEKFYSPAIREIKRVGLELVEEYIDPSNEIEAKRHRFFWQAVVKAICFVLEQDLPYLWRLMDVLQGVNKDAMAKHPAKEVKRLVQVFAERDHARSWKQMGYLVWFLVLMRPEIKSFIQKFVEKLDITRMWFDEADLYWCLGSGDEENGGYDFLGLPREKRLEFKAKITTQRVEQAKEFMKNAPYKEQFEPSPA